MVNGEWSILFSVYYSPLTIHYSRKRFIEFQKLYTSLCSVQAVRRNKSSIRAHPMITK